MFGFLKKLFAPANKGIIKEAIEAGALLIDVRNPDEFAGSNIKGSVNIPLNRLSNQAHALKKYKAVVVFCQSGARSRAAKALLEKNGLTNILNGGSMYSVIKLITTK